MTDKEVKPLLSGRSYDILKMWAVIILPALGALYFGLAQIWGFPAGEQVVGTIVLIDTFVGSVLKISERSYEASGAKYDGAVNVASDPEGNKTMSLEFDGDPYDLDKQDEVRLKVQPVPPEQA